MQLVFAYDLFSVLIFSLWQFMNECKVMKYIDLQCLSFWYNKMLFSCNVSLNMRHFPQMGLVLVETLHISKCKLLLPICTCLWSCHWNTKLFLKEGENELWPSQVQFPYQVCHLFSLLTRPWLQSFTEEEGVEAKRGRQKLGFEKDEWDSLRIY